jgi:hypothetical protein
MTTTHEIGQTMISIKINPNQVEKGIVAGIKKNLVTPADQAQKRARDVETAGGKEKAARLDRIDTAGQIVFDGGNLLFLGRARGEEKYLRCEETVKDLFNLGFHVSKFEIMVKQGDKSGGFLRIFFSNTKPEAEIPEGKIEDFINSHLTRVYRSAYGYINQAYGDDPINTTFNFSGSVLDQKELDEHAPEVKELRILKMSHPGHCACKRMV